MRNLKFIFVSIFVLTLFSSECFSANGNEGSGGGDPRTLDFVKTAHQLVFPWLLANGAKLKPAVDANEFILNVDSNEISSIDHVFESCDGSNGGREVAACYNSSLGKIFLSQSLYPLYANKSVKIGLVAHEIFRKMGIEGDQYEVTRQMEITNEVTVFDKFIFESDGNCSDVENLLFLTIAATINLGTDNEDRPILAYVTLQLFSDHTYWMRYVESVVTDDQGNQQNLKVIFKKVLEGNWSAVGNQLFISDIGTGLPGKYRKDNGFNEDGVNFTFSKPINNKILTNKSETFGRVLTNIGPRGIRPEEYCKQ